MSLAFHSIHQYLCIEIKLLNRVAISVSVTYHTLSTRCLLPLSLCLIMCFCHGRSENQGSIHKSTEIIQIIRSSLRWICGQERTIKSSLPASFSFQTVALNPACSLVSPYY